jgi:vancomycin aglycone glucosyltransferase
VFQSGAWIVSDERPLPEELEEFLERGDPPVYFGFGSIRAPEGLCKAMIASARALGCRAIVSRGWADLSLTNEADDCLAIGEVNLQQLLRRVAAAVHHGGAGTTTTAAMAGERKVFVPQVYDQHYWAERVRQLGIGTAHAAGTPSAESLTAALEQALRPEVGRRARVIAAGIRRDGAEIAARRIAEVARS